MALKPPCTENPFTAPLPDEWIFTAFLRLIIFCGTFCWQCSVAKDSYRRPVVNARRNRRENWLIQAAALSIGKIKSPKSTYCVIRIFQMFSVFGALCIIWRGRVHGNTWSILFCGFRFPKRHGRSFVTFDGRIAEWLSPLSCAMFWCSCVPHNSILRFIFRL